MQSVNFYLDSYRPKPLSFDRRFALLSIIICLLGLIVIGWLESQQVNNLQNSLNARQKQLSYQQEQLALVAKKLKTHSVIKKLQTQLTNSQQELISYRKIASQVNIPLSYIPINFSQILNDLSLNTVNSLWLTKINIKPEHLSLSGTTTKANLIPTYIDKIKNADSLKRHFDELKIERNNTNNQLINFQLINGKLTNE